MGFRGGDSGGACSPNRSLEDVDTNFICAAPLYMVFIKPDGAKES